MYIDRITGRRIMRIYADNKVELTIMNIDKEYDNISPHVFLIPRVTLIRLDIKTARNSSTSRRT
jgi:hypothetical protein